MSANASINPNIATSAPSVLDASDKWVALDEGARHAGVSTATLRRAIRRGELRHARVSNRKILRLRLGWIDEWLLATTTPVEVRRADR